MTAATRRTVLAALAAGIALPAAARAATPRIGRDWPTASPEAMGLDPSRLATAADKLGAAGERQGLVIVRDGRLVFERYWANAFHRADPEWRNVSFSSGKSWGATMVGRAITQGKLRVDDLASRYVPPERTGLLPGVTIKHLLTMSSGGTLVVKSSSRPPRRLDDPTPPGLPDEYRRTPGKSEEPNAPGGYGISLQPGTLFFYDGAAADHLAEIVSAAVRTPSHDYMMAEIAGSLGCRHFGYQPEGVDNNRDVRIGGSILLSCRDMARLGQLYLDGGRWNGRQLIDRAYIAAATAPSERNPAYGYLWWLNGTGRVAAAPRSMFFAAGARGQFCFVVPERRLVIATMGFGAAQLSADQAWAALGPALLG